MLGDRVNNSLLSKRFQWRYYAKVKAGAKKKKMEGERGGEKRNACPQTPQFWKTLLDISRFFGSFVNLQLVEIEASITNRLL